MRKLAALIALFGLTLALAGCGGDSGCGALNGGGSSSTSSTSTCTGSTGGNTNPTPAAVKVTSSATTIADDGSTTVTITAVVTNSSGTGISGATVSFTTTAGTLAASTATTSSTGAATTTLTANGVAVGTVITVTGTDGTLTGNASVTAANPVVTGNGVASLAISSNVTSIPADGSTTATITVLAKNSSNVAMTGVSVALSASAGTLSGATTTTDANGDVTAKLSGVGATAGSTITLTATSGTAKNTFTISVVSVQQTLTILASSPTMPSNNSAPVTISAIVQNASNQLVPGVAVLFQASSGAIASTATTAGATANPVVPAGTTDINGMAQATLTTPGNPQNRFITVTVTAGSSTSTVQIQVVGTQLAVSGPASLVLSAAGSYSVSLTDSGGAGISGQTVALTSALGNTLTPGSVTTGSTGTAAFQMTGVNSGNDTITATWQGVTQTLAVSVSNQNFMITAPTTNASINVTTTATPNSVPVTLSWTSSGVGQSGTVNLSTSRGTLSTSTMTVSNGTFTPASVTLSSTTAGPATISATALNSSGQVVATTEIPVTFVASVPTTLAVQANPSTVPLQGQSTITATVTDANGNPVSGAQVDFGINDPTGGNLSTGQATTVASGQASVIYTASTTTSTPGGVVITAVLDKYQSITSGTNLTVGGQAVSLKLGTGLSITANTTQFILPYTVTAYDASGVGVSGVNVSFTVTSVAYATGSYSYGGTPAQWNQNVAAPPTGGDPLEVPGIGGCSPVSVYELNGVIQTGNQTLLASQIPSNWIYTAVPSSVAAISQSPVTTAAGGSATINLTYTQNYATWVAVSLTATAIVQGTQNSTTATFWLPALDTDITEQSPPPPFVVSPFGTATSCYANQPQP